MSSSTHTRRALRNSIRQKRRSLPRDEQAWAANAVCKKILQSQLYRDSRHIALFLAADGEIDLTEVFTQARHDGKTCYLPVCLHETCTLEFYPWFPGADLSTTPLGVLEPAMRDNKLEPDALDLVLTPLVAFDMNCQRMGMGKGFYDRTFSFKTGNEQETGEIKPVKAPILLGVAHECQRVENLETAWWDVPMDAVITPASSYGSLKIV